MILKERKFDDFILRVIKFEKLIALDFFNYSLGMFLKVFKLEEEADAIKMLNNITKEEVIRIINK